MRRSRTSARGAMISTEPSREPAMTQARVEALPAHAGAAPVGFPHGGEAVAAVMAADPIMRGGFAVLVRDPATGRMWIRMRRVGDPDPEPAPEQLIAFRAESLRARGIVEDPWPPARSAEPL